MRKIVLYSLLFISYYSVAQNSPTVPNPKLPTIGVPQPNIPNPYQYQTNRQQVNPYDIIDNDAIQKRNQQLINETVEAERRNAQSIQPQSDIQMLASKGFPSQSYQEGTSSYYKAFDEINNMLEGKQQLNLGRAIFLVENAYYNNKLNYEDFQKTITDQIKICNEKIREEKLNKENNLVKNMMLFRLISDTLKIKPVGVERSITHFPIKYDLDDYKSEKHFDCHFVTKLMKSGYGQCYSMPLYYLILAEKIGAKAYWAFSPQHSFIKIQDERGTWYNLELTCNAILSDAHYMNSSYIKAEAIRNRIYLEPMDKKEVVAQMLVELGRGYYEKFGLDNFYLNCSRTSSQHLSNQLDPILMEAFYEQRLTLTLAKLLDAKKPEIMKEKFPQAYRHFEKSQALYDKVDNLGYENLPEGIYARWLEHINKLKEKEKENKRKTILTNGVK